MITPDDIVNAALKYKGTPYHHGGRIPGVGLDCAGMLALVGKDLGIEVVDDTAYPTAGLLEPMKAAISLYCDEIVGTPERADFFVFHGRLLPHHVGIYTGPEKNSLVHVWAHHGGLVDMPLNDWWLNQLDSVFRLKPELWER